MTSLEDLKRRRDNWTQGKIERLRDDMLRIVQWADAYPLEVFPEPDLKLARKGLESVGITMDQVSAHCMRHVIKGAGDIARKALEGSDECR